MMPSASNVSTPAPVIPLCADSPPVLVVDGFFIPEVMS
jgi:hypothetical protein